MAAVDGEDTQEIINRDLPIEIAIVLAGAERLVECFDVRSVDLAVSIDITGIDLTLQLGYDDRLDEIQIRSKTELWKIR